MPPIDPETGWAVWGQPRAVTTLQQALQQGPAHSWIFAGPPGTGKHATALALATALCCPNRGQDMAGCGTCSVCRRIERGVFPDVTGFSLERQAERDGDKSRNLTLNIATVREISAAVAFRPTEARWRVVIVRDAETMQEPAQEAFLKTLEEPPPYAVIILLADELEPILPTIQSRASVVRFGPASEQVITSALVAGGVDAGQASTVAEVAEGSAGWAFRAINDPQLVQLRETELHEARQFVQGGAYDRMVTCIRLADMFGKDRETVFRQLGWVQGVWRTLLHQSLGTYEVKSGAGAKERALQLVKAVRSVDRCMANLEANVRPRLAMETMVAMWPPVAE